MGNGADTGRQHGPQSPEHIRNVVLVGPAARAESAENCGESATTATPQNTRIARANAPCPATAGKARPASAEPASATAATRALPYLRLKCPPTMQPTPP